VPQWGNRKNQRKNGDALNDNPEAKGLALQFKDKRKTLLATPLTRYSNIYTHSSGDSDSFWVSAQVTQTEIRTS